VKSLRALLAKKLVRRMVAVVAAVIVAAAVFFLRRAGLLEGVPAAVLAILLVVFLPSSSLLSRRILLAGAVFLGWVPLMWWVRLPVPDVDRMGILLALAFGALVLWVFWGADLRPRAKRLVPQVAIVDAMPVAAAGIAGWAMWPLLASSAGERSLSVLVKMGWDHAAHLGMAFTARAEGAIAPMIRQGPDGSPWVWGDYPQHFHATVTALTELFSGSALGDVGTEVVRYGRSLALVQVLTVMLLTAGLAQLPSLRRRPVLAWPLGALVVAAFLFGPGSWALYMAFPNFVLASATAGLAVLLATAMSGGLRPYHLVALGGLVVATVHGWVLLAPLAVAACVVALVPLRRERWPATRWGRLAAIAAVLLTALASAVVVPVLVGAGGVEALASAEGFLPSGFARLSLLLLTGGACLAVSVAACVLGQTRESLWRGISLVGVSVMGFALVGLVGVYVRVTAADALYYFDKVLVGVSLVSVVVLAASVEMLAGALPTVSGRGRRSIAGLASVVALVAALQVFGLQGLEYRATARELVDAPVPAAERILRAAELSGSRPFGSTVYLAAMPGDPAPKLAYQWNRALSVMWTYGSGVRAEFPKRDMSVERAAEWVQAQLISAPQRTVIVAPEIADSVRSLVPEELRGRVISWE
jgi:hypothetical protein